MHVDSGWAGPVQSQEWRVEFHRPKVISLNWRRQCGRKPWVSSDQDGCGFSIAVGVVLATKLAATMRSQKASTNELTRRKKHQNRSETGCVSLAQAKKPKGKHKSAAGSYVTILSIPLPRSVFAAPAVSESITKAYSSRVLTLFE